MSQNNNKIVSVGITMPKKELEEMKQETRVDLNGPAVLSMARLGMQTVKSNAKK